MHLPGPQTVIHSISLSYVRPVFVGQAVRYRVEVTKLVASVKVIQLRLSVLDGEGGEIVRGTASCGVKSSE